MATYIPGMTDYIPQIQSFQPDYNFLSNTLQTRQSRYDAAHKQLSSVYGTLLNSPMLRDENIQRREQLFKAVDGDIKRISGLDLSLKQNQDAAMQVFKPFYEDKDMHKDMVWTKNFHNELQRAESFKYCVDPDKCGGQYWEGGVEAIKYKADEFRKASKDEALNFSDASFTPSVNVMDKAMKAAKDAGFKVSFDSVQGGYIVTDKNGTRMIAPLKSFFLNKFGNDPSVISYYKALAYNERKKFTLGNAQAMGGEDKSTIAYMNHIYQGVTENIDKTHEKAQADHDRIKTLKDAADQKIKKGVLESDRAIFDMWDSLREQQDATAQTRDITQGAKNKLDATKNYSNNARAMGEHLDDLMAYAMLDKEVGNAAKAYADLTSERDIKADPYALASYNSKLNLSNQMQGKAADFEYWKIKEQIKAQNESIKNNRDLGDPVFNAAQPGASGQATGVIDENMAFNQNRAGLVNLTTDKRASLSNIISEFGNTLRAQYENSAKDPIKQNLLSATADIAFKGTGIDGKKIANGDREELAKLQNLDPAKMNKAYEQIIKTVDPNGGPTGELNSDWSRDFWNKTQGQRTEIRNLDKKTGDRIKWMEKQSKNVTNAVSGELRQKDPVTGKQKADLLTTMTDLSHIGSLPPISDPETVRTIASDYANKHQRDFGNWQSAYSFATTNIPDVASQWYNGYKSHAVSWDQADGFGKTSNARMGGGYTHRYDAAMPSNNNTLILSDLLKNTSAIGGDAIVQFGDAGTIIGNDPAAKRLLDQISTDFFSTDLKHPKENRLRGTFTAQPIAGANPDYMGYTINLDENYIKTHQGSEKQPGIARGLTAGQPVTVFIPKDKADNNFYRSTQYSDNDFQLQKGEGLVFNDYPDAGDIKIERVGNQYQTHGHLNWIDEKGNPHIEPVEGISNDIDADIITEEWNKKLANMAAANVAQKQRARLQYGVKTLAEFQKLMSEQGLHIKQ